MKQSVWRSVWGKLGAYLMKIAVLFITYFLIELFAFILIGNQEYSALGFGALWACLFAMTALLLPRIGGQIFFGITYGFSLLWTLAQTGYYAIFGRMIWLSDVFYAAEGADYLGDVAGMFGALWWIGGVILLGIGVILVWKFPKSEQGLWARLPYLGLAALSIAGLLLAPELVFLKDLDIWGTRSEFGQSSSYRATYNTMYDAKKTYDICGVYHLTIRDIWEHEIYPLTLSYQKELQAQKQEIDDYFAKRNATEKNEMTGILSGKNVILVLMESMDDWMITPQDTPTILKLMNEGIQFTDFYTPVYGTARTLNSEFCVNTGLFLPTNGHYVFDYITNEFNQSFANQMADNGYTPEVFHYNTREFYSRGVFEPTMGYDGYNSYGDYETDKNKLYDDCLLFDIPELADIFFREGKTFNTIITRSAHLSYKYNEVLSHYALKQYPEYRGKFASQEEDCARVKAKLVDDMFARLLTELALRGQLENTVIIGVTDHYTYGYKNTEELLALSGVTDEMLLEKTPCFVWSADCPQVLVEKTLNTADFLPTMLNFLGISSPYSYLGQDAFDSQYEGYALFSNGSWICDGITCKVSTNGNSQILTNPEGREIAQSELEKMSLKVRDFIRISNLLLTSDYYKNTPS